MTANVAATTKVSFAGVLAVFGWAALALQLWLSISGAVRADESVFAAVVEYCGYFTIVTNAFCALVGGVYHFLLRSQWDPHGLQFVADLALHYVMPVAFLFFWVDAVPRGALAQRDILGWVRYPLAYTLYVFVRGMMLGEYPYFFIDVPTLGWLIALRNAGLALVGYLVVSSLLVMANRFGGLIRPLES